MEDSLFAQLLQVPPVSEAEQPLWRELVQEAVAEFSAQECEQGFAALVSSHPLTFCAASVLAKLPVARIPADYPAQLVEMIRPAFVAPGSVLPDAPDLAPPLSQEARRLVMSVMIRASSNESIRTDLGKLVLWRELCLVAAQLPGGNWRALSKDLVSKSPSSSPRIRAVSRILADQVPGLALTLSASQKSRGESPWPMPPSGEEATVALWEALRPAGKSEQFEGDEAAEWVKILIEQGADVNSPHRMRRHFRPLEAALEAKAPQVVKILLEAGAEVGQGAFDFLEKQVRDIHTSRTSAPPFLKPMALLLAAYPLLPQWQTPLRNWQNMLTRREGKSEFSPLPELLDSVIPGFLQEFKALHQQATLRLAITEGSSIAPRRM